MERANSIYVIRDAETGQFVSYNKKAAWLTVGAAKNSYSAHTFNKACPWKQMRFDEQTRYVIEEIQ